MSLLTSDSFNVSEGASSSESARASVKWSIEAESRISFQIKVPFSV